MDPEFAASYLNRGVAYECLGNYVQALEDLNKFIELNPNSAASCSNRGNIFRELGKYGQALNDLNRAIELDSVNAAAYYNRGILYGQQLHNYNQGQADIQSSQIRFERSSRFIKTLWIRW